MSKFRHLSIFSLFSLGCITLVLLADLPSYINQNFSEERLNYATFSPTFLQNFAITILAFSCHIEFVPIYHELKNPTVNRTKKVVQRAFTMNTLFYLLIGMTGYFSTYELTPKIVLEREGLQYGKSDIPMMICRALMIFVLCVAYPIKIVAFKQIIFTALTNSNKEVS